MEKFRRFGFIGYKTEDQAKAALHHFNSSFIDTSKITVDFAKNLGDESLPRAWSKYSEGSSANERFKKGKERKASKLTETKISLKTPDINKEKSNVVNEKNKKKRTEVLNEDLERDVEFQEFLSTWSNDNTAEGSKPETKKKQKKERKEKTVVENKSSESQVKYDDSDGSGNEDDIYDASGEELQKREMKIPKTMEKMMRKKPK
ncbi:putative RNA-binding protein 19 [Desmophyllum pertusum]|uniref:RNA-binding protein 19 n=1 Tax=Desmophyllum pertusum TaxID=174260 RepID=A0A9X0CGM2_9CNID|nr:putative RNA-binding protein 19 [Desmophyllum pertusum]